MGLGPCRPEAAFRRPMLVPPANPGPNNFVMGVPLPDHGVVAFIRQSGAGEWCVLALQARVSHP